MVTKVYTNLSKIITIDIKVPSSSGLVSNKTRYHSGKQHLKEQMEDVNKKIILKRLITTQKLQRLKARFLVLVTTTELTITTALNKKATLTENKTASITNLVNKDALNIKTTEIENKTSDTNHLTREFNRLTKISFDTRM